MVEHQLTAVIDKERITLVTLCSKSDSVALPVTQVNMTGRRGCCSALGIAGSGRVTWANSIAFGLNPMIRHYSLEVSRRLALSESILTIVMTMHQRRHKNRVYVLLALKLYISINRAGIRDSKTSVKSGWALVLGNFGIMKTGSNRNVPSTLAGVIGELSPPLVSPRVLAGEGSSNDP